MASQYDDDEEDVLAPTEPQVTSEDPEERKAARRNRILKRQEALRKAQLPPEEAVCVEDATLTEKATMAAAETLQQSTLEGAAKVTNVKVTTDEREVMRRHLCAAEQQATLEKIEADAAETQLQYEAITQNWEAMMKIKDPLDIKAAMAAQKDKCDELLAIKDSVITKLRGDLKRMDEDYFEDLKKQDSDIKELSERIEKQITIMSRAFEKQLNLIEAAMDVERDIIVEHNNKRWDALYRQRDKEEVAHIEYKIEQHEEHKERIDKIMWDHFEKYRQTKMELNNLCSELQKELEKLKATCLINTEKVGYNYQVLKKREEENVFVRSQQKRKLNKMTDMANALRKKIAKAASEGALEETKADTEIAKIMQAMDDLEKKSKHFSEVNNYKFIQVWRMTACRCATLARELRCMEVALHAHVLAEAPPAPPPPIPRSPISAKVEESSQKTEGSETATTVKSPSIGQLEEDSSDAKDKLVRHILQLVADNTGFLVEDRLLKLIEKYPLTSRNLCTLDAIFMALEISAEADVELLCNTFLEYAFCPICVGIDDGGTSDFAPDAVTSSVQSDTNVPKGRQSSARTRASVARSMSTSTARSAHVGFKGQELTVDEHALMAEADEIMNRVGDPQAPQAMKGAASDAGGSAKRAAGVRGVTVTSTLEVAPVVVADPYRCPMGHLYEIEPMQVLTALSDFISKFLPPEKKKLHDLLESLQPPVFESLSRKLPEQVMEQYWSLWKLLFPIEKERFWDGILKGLNNYLNVLQERDKLHEEVVVLRRRNEALRDLVRGAMPSLPPISRRRPQYAEPYPDAFTAAREDFGRLPSIM